MKKSLPIYLLIFIFLGLKTSFSQEINMKHLGSYHTGIFDDGAAEISTYSETSQKLFFTNAANKTIDFLDIKDVYNPTLLGSIDITPYGGNVNSIFAFDNYLAAAIENNIKQDSGVVVIFNTDGIFLKQFTVGALPDMLIYEPIGKKLIVANEGEPNDDYTIDPEGSISIIELSNGLLNAIVTNLDFSAFEYVRNSFESNNDDNWNFTQNPTPYDISGDVWGVRTSLSSINGLHNNSFWGMQDLDNSNGGGNFWHTIDFDAIDISNKPRCELSFKYYTIGYESSDSIGYIVEFNNGSNWTQTNYVDLAKDTSWTNVSINVSPGTQYVRVRLMAKQNGGSDYAAFDDVRLSFLDSSTRIFGNNYLSNVRQDLEPEYIALSDDGQRAWVSLQENNALAIIDLNTNQIIDIKGMGYKDHSLFQNAFDASDKPSTVEIKKWPTKGMYQADAIYGFEINGINYVATANEGDSRDYSGYSEEDRCDDLILDSIAFPNAVNLQNEDSLGRIKITYANGDIDFDGEYEEIYTYGGRSFSIYDENGNQVYDSGNEFEQKLFALAPNEFNSNNDDNTSFKKRSDDKGCEPEAIVTAKIENRTFAFIGLERMGGIMIYDISNPNAPSFVQYLNNRDFTQPEDSSSTGDLAPEGLIFIPKNISPNHRNLLISSNEVSGTISIFEINLDRTINDFYALDTFQFNSTPLIGYYGDTIYEGGISGMHYINGSNNEFYLITDRGPNVEAENHPLATGKTKFFPFPSYAPKIMHVSAQSGDLIINSMNELKRPDSTNASGIPLPLGLGSTGENAWSDTMATLVNPDIWGIDSEGILEDNNGDIWICDEYGASIWRVNKQSKKVIKRFTPFANETQDIAIDTMIGKRRPNRGFEGIAYTPNGMIYAILQSPIYNPNSSTSDSSQIHRIIQINPEDNTMKTFVYVHEDPIGEIRNKDWKIGDLVSINNDEFLVIEHAQRNGWNYKNIYKINISNATPILSENYNGNSLEGLIDETGLQANGIIPVHKEEYLDLLELNWNMTHDKPEGISVINDSTIALINDNDYGIDSPNDDGNISFTGKKTQLYIYHLPNDKWINYIAPYCSTSLPSDTVICQNDYFVINAQNSNSYLWNTNSLNSYEIADASILGAGSHTYWVQTTDVNGCKSTDSIQIDIDNGIAVNLGNDTTLCEGNSLTLDAGVAQSYTWSTGENTQTIDVNQTGFYTVTISNSNGCETSDGVLINIIDCSSLQSLAEFGINVYPIPTTNKLNIKLDHSIIESIKNIRLIDMTGRNIKTINNFGTTNQFDVSFLNSGIYQLIITSNDSKYISKIQIVK